ncbi:hypothetical protein P691DRAFT_759088 [Macrolepiota fuliginosa MF-IS2]|uniref:Uncharacterized protein n=1 Tax=Macrolepiota fuliginosa MF-IS2 TaxID=1400762 RepID=A0A9P6C2W4_9AGAR|nr:hypothetical protein P691DRAFT_759088 [Macrolepiota fuliginosa MF-IS2]
MDSLFDFDIPFANTAQFDGHRNLNVHLELRDDRRPVMEPIPPTFDNWASDESSSGEDSPLMPDSFAFYDAVSSSFSPGGGDSHEFSYKMNNREPALMDGMGTGSMTLITTQGEAITVRPRCKFRREISRACVEMAVSEWMVKQRALPLDAPNRHVIEWRYNRYIVDGEVKRAAVWLWKGLEQVPYETNTFQISL